MRGVRVTKVQMLVGLAAFLVTSWAGPSDAYNGNVPWMMWDCLVRQCKAKFDRCNGISKIALKHLKAEGFGRCEKARAALAKRSAAGDLTEPEMQWIEQELRFVSAREKFLQGLMDTTLFWRQEIFDKPGQGVLGQSVDEIRFCYDLNLKPLLLERQAAELEFGQNAFGQAREIELQALRLRRDAVQAIQDRIQALKAGQPVAGEVGGDPAARAKYLEFHLAGFQSQLEALEREVEMGQDPDRLLSMAAFFAAREQFGGDRVEFRHRPPKAMVGQTTNQFYRAKAAFACDLRAAAEPAQAERWARLKSQITESREDPRPMAGPDWYMPVFHEPGWYDFPMGPWQESDEDSR